MLATHETDKRTARIIGTLFLISYAGVFIGSEISGAVLNESDYLLNAYPDRGQATVGVLIELLNDLAIVGIAVLLYPLLRKVSEGVALFYVGLRVIEAAFLMVYKVGSMSLIEISERFLESGTTNPAGFEDMGTQALVFREAAGWMGAISFMVGGLALYYLLYRSELVPRFISVWGLLAVGSLMAAIAFEVPDLTQGFEPAMVLYFPIVINELFLAGWLLVKGFSSRAIASEPKVRVLARQ